MEIDHETVQHDASTKYLDPACCLIMLIPGHDSFFYLYI